MHNYLINHFVFIYIFISSWLRRWYKLKKKINSKIYLFCWHLCTWYIWSFDLYGGGLTIKVSGYFSALMGTKLLNIYFKHLYFTTWYINVSRNVWYVMFIISYLQNIGLKKWNQHYIHGIKHIFLISEYILEMHHGTPILI